MNSNFNNFFVNSLTKCREKKKTFFKVQEENERGERIEWKKDWNAKEWKSGKRKERNECKKEKRKKNLWITSVLKVTGCPKLLFPGSFFVGTRDFNTGESLGASVAPSPEVRSSWISEGICLKPHNTARTLFRNANEIVTSWKNCFFFSRLWINHYSLKLTNQLREHSFNDSENHKNFISQLFICFFRLSKNRKLFRRCAFCLVHGISDSMLSE